MITPDTTARMKSAAERVGRATALVDLTERSRLNFTPQPAGGSQHQPPPSWVVRVTGAVLSSGLYPAVCRELTISGSAGWQDAADEEECYAYHVAGLAMAVDATDVGLFVCEEPEDGKSVFAIQPGATVAAAVIDVCLVVDGYGNPTGTLRLTRRKADGTLECVEREPCPEEGCPPKWWCVAGEPTEIAIGGTVPDGAEGPFDSEAEALEACPPPPIEVTCDECETPWLLPSDGFYLTFANQSGTSFPNTIWLEQGFADLNCSSGPTSGWGPGYHFDDGTTTASIRFCWSCPGGGGGGLSVEIYIFGFAATITVPAPAGWVTAGGSLRKTIPCGEQFAWDQFIGEVNFGSGTADVYLSN